MVDIEVIVEREQWNMCFILFLDIVTWKMVLFL